MYKIFCDGNLIHDDALESLRVLNPKYKGELNKTGSFTFQIRPDHPYYSLIYRMKSMITVYQDNYILFRGRVLNDEIGFRNEKDIECEGELSFLLDSIVRPYEYSGSVSGFFTKLINDHNAQVQADHKFTVGQITVTDSNGTISRSSEGYEKTWKTLNDKLIKLLGGYVWIRHENGVNYIDYLTDFNVLSSQTVEFGKNLVDLKKERRGEEIITALIPIGKDGLTIDAVNDGKDYVYNAEAVSKYGWIFATNEWKDVTVATNLKTKGQNYLDSNVLETQTIELSASDLSGIGYNVSAFHLGTYVKVKTAPHGIDDNFLVNKIDIDLMNPANNKLSLGATGKTISDFTTEVSSGVKGDKGDPGKDAAIQSDTEPSDKTYMWLDISEDPPVLKRYNSENETWDIVNDQAQILLDLEERTQSSINSTSDSIMTRVSEEYYLKGETDQIVSELSSSFEQTARGFEMQFSSLTSDITNVSENADDRFTEISKYIRFVNGTIVLGESGSELTLKIENDKIVFLQNNAEVAYFTDNKLFVTDGEFTNSMQLGNFAFFPRTNGNLSFKKVK